MHCVGLVDQVASKLLSADLIWEAKEVGEFAPGSPCFLALLSRDGLPPCQLGSWGKYWPQPGWWDWKAEPQSPKVSSLH